MFNSWWKGCREDCVAYDGKVSSVHIKRAFGHRDGVRAVLRHPPRRVSSCEIINSGVIPTRTLAMRNYRAAFRLMSCSACM
jgi:hypothetical protein